MLKRQVNSIELAQAVEACLEGYEQAFSHDPGAKLEDFIPDPEGRHYRHIALELFRCDMELRWLGESRREARSYISAYPNVFDETSQIEKIAFEEFRIRHSHGENVTASQYQDEFQIDTSAWPVWRNDDHFDEEASERVARMSKRSGASKIDMAVDQIFPRPGDCFLEFDILGELGRGACGRVYLARQNDLARRLVALKLTKKATDEANYLAQLQHSNIVPVYSVHRHRGLTIICMPFLGYCTLQQVTEHLTAGSTKNLAMNPLVTTVMEERGKSVRRGLTSRDANDHDFSLVDLHDASDKSQPMTETHQQTVLRLVSDIASALAHAHEKGIVHGDLKPGNILLSEDGRPLVLDFHLAREDNQADSQSVGGTLPYMAAEQIRALFGESTYGPPADVFSIGVILFELSYGRLPFPTYSNRLLPDSIEKMIEDRKSIPRMPDRSVAPGTAEIIKRCLDADQSKRYPTAKELAEDLQCQREHRLLNHAPNRSLAEICQKWYRRHPRLAILFVSAAILMLLVFGFRGALASRDSRISQLEVSETARDFARQVDSIIPALTVFDADLRDLESSRTNVLDTLRQAPLDSRQLDHIPPASRWSYQSALGRAWYMMAECEARLATSRAASQYGATVERAISHHEKAKSYLGGESHSAIRIQGDRLQAMKRGGSLGDTAESIIDPASISSSLDELLWGIQLRRIGEDQRAIQHFQRAISDFPSNYNAWLLLGNSYAAIGETREAAACYTVCIGLDSHSPWAYQQRGVARMEAGDWAGAIDDFEMVLSKRPEEVTTLANRGLARWNLGQLQAAEEDFTAAIELGAVRTRIYFLRSDVRLELGDEQGAESDRETGLRLEPRDEVSWLTRGTRRVADDPSGALEDFQRALECNPNSTAAWQNIAATQSELLGNTREAIDALDHLLKLSANDAVNRASRGVLYARLGDAEAALRDGRDAIQQSQDAEVVYRIAGIFALLSRDQQQYASRATAMLRRASQADPSYVASVIDTDVDLDAIRELPEFQSIRAWVSGPTRATPSGSSAVSGSNTNGK